MLAELTELDYDLLESVYWDGYIIKREELRREQSDMFDECSSETTQACRRAGIRRIVDELKENLCK